MCRSESVGVQVRMMKEERGRVEGALEEARSRELEQRSRADALKQELDLQRTQAQRHLTQVHIHCPPIPRPPLAHHGTHLCRVLA